MTIHNPFEFDGDHLNIRAIENPQRWNNENRTHGPIRDILHQQRFLSGVISTYDKFSTRYGYFEARINFLKHDGAFPAFWLHHQRRGEEGTQRSEIDIMENLGHDTSYVYNSFHSGDQMIKPTQPGDTQLYGQIYSGVDYGDDFHVYAVSWEPGTIRWYIDGELINELRDGRVDNEDLCIILNLAMGGTWTNMPSSVGGLDHSYPNGEDLNNFRNPALEIDYVRAYKRN